MHAQLRALGVVGVRSRALAVVGLVLSSLALAVGAPGRARADDPTALSSPAASPAAPPAASRDGPLVMRLALENDNLLLGNYGRMAGRALDGTDLGRTHAAMLMLGYDLQDWAALRLDLSTQLFTVALDGAEPGRNAIVPVHFHELDQLRLGVRLGHRDAPWRVRFGLEGEVSNPEEVTIGGSGQQRAWHEFLADTIQTGAWKFEHRPSGRGVVVGAAVDGRAGGRTEIALAPWITLLASGDAGARLATIFAGSALRAHGRIGAVLGDRRGGARLIVSAEHHTMLWLETPGLMLRSTIDVRLDVGVAALEVALHRYDGDQNVPYFFYAFPNTTMTIALVGRL